MKKFSLLLVVSICLNSCSIIEEISFFEKKSESIIITNATKNSIRIKTYPSIDAGGLEKSIRFFYVVNKSPVWKDRFIDCVIIKHDWKHQDSGEYLMNPASSFHLGFSYKSGRKKFRPEDLDIEYLEIYLTNDTIVAKTKEEIVALAKNPRFRKQKGDKINKKYFRYDYFKIVVAERHLK